MRFNLSMVLIIRIILILSLWSSSVYSEDLVLKLAYSDVEFFPYEIGNVSYTVLNEPIPDPPGIAIELITQAANDLGLKLELKRFPNKRVLEYVKTGIEDGVFSFSFNEERLSCGQYPMRNGALDSSRRITTVSYYLYKLKNSSLEWNGHEMKNLNGALGANSGYSIIDDLIKKGYIVEEAKSTEQNLMKLSLGRICGFASQNVTTDHLVDSGKYGDIVKLTIPLATKDYFLILSHQFMQYHSDIGEKLWNKIGEIREVKTKELIPYYYESLK